MTYTRATTQSKRFISRTTVDTNVSVTNADRLWIGSRTGTKVQNWKVKIREGSDASSAYSADQYSLVFQRDGAASLSYEQILPPGWPTPPARGFHGFDGDANPPPNALGFDPVLEADRNVALAKFYRRLRATYEHMNLPALLAEASDISSGFIKPFRGLNRLIEKAAEDAHKRRNGLTRRYGTKIPRKELSRAMSDTWLEIQFGLVPLISDTQSIAEALRRFIDDVGERQKKIRVRHSASRVDSTTTRHGISGTWLAAMRTDQYAYSHSYQFTAGLAWALDPEYLGSLDHLMDLFGLRARNLASAAWEGTPFSWVLDYFGNIGSVIDSYGVNTASVVWANETARRFVQLQRSTVHLPAESIRAAALSNFRGTASGSNLGSSKLTRTSMVRTVLIPGNLPKPEVAFNKLPNLTQGINLVAVLHGMSGNFLRSAGQTADFVWRRRSTTTT